METPTKDLVRSLTVLARFVADETEAEDGLREDARVGSAVAEREDSLLGEREVWPDGVRTSSEEAGESS
jgi:hypothetical protein